jgi:hypothetical protein
MVMSGDLSRHAVQKGLTSAKQQSILHHMERIFTIWPTAADLARDIGENPVTVRHWRRRGSIPARFDRSIVDAAAKRGASLSFEDMANARATKTTEAAE